MVDYSAPAPELTLSEQPRTQIDSSVFNRPLKVSIGQGEQQLGAGLEDLADSQAKQQAASDLQKGVTLDANGQPQVGTSANSFIFGRAGEDYHALMLQGTKAALQSKVTNDLTDLRQQNPTDPAAFQTAASGYVNGLRNSSNLPAGVGDALANQAADAAAQHHASMVEASMTRDTHNSLQTIQTQIGDTRDKLSALARQGGMNTPQYDQLQDTLQDGYDALTSNPLFGYSPARAQSELDTTTAQLQGDMLVSQVDQTFKKTGGDGGRAGAQKMLTDEILNNPDLHLDDQQRRSLYSQGMAHLSYLTTENKAQIDANRITVEKLVDTLKSGVKVDPSVVGAAQAQAQSLGDAESVMKIGAYAQQAQATKAYAGLSDEQRLHAMTDAASGTMGSERQALDFFTSKGWTPAQAAGIVGNLTRESGLRTGAYNPGDGSDGSDSIGLAQWNGARAVALKQFAGAQGKSVNDFGTQLAFVQHELEGSEGNAAAMLRKAGTAQDAASAFALGFERPQGFLTGDINQVAGGKDRVAAAVRLAGGNASNALVYSGPLRSGVNPPTAAQMQANPFVMAAYVDSLSANAKVEVSTAKSVGEALTTRFEKGDTPQPETVAAFQQMQAKYPDQLAEIGQKVDTQMRASLAAQGAQQMPGGQGPAYIQQVEAAKQGADLNVQARADATKAIYDKGAAALKADPAGEALKRGWIARPPAPFDFASPEGAAAVPQAMQDRAVAAAAIAAHTGVAGTSALGPADLPQVKSVMTSGTLDQRMAVLGSITGAGMSEPVLRATLGELASSKETLPLAVAGSLAKEAPEAARGILQGQALMQAEPKLAPNKDDFPAELAKVLPFNDLANTKAREGIDGAVQAYYAKLSADAGDTTGVLNADRVSKAVDAVTGGVFAYRGAKAIAPWYGASQGDTDAAIRSLGDGDFARARTADGSPFPASALKPSFSGAFTWNNWRLQSYGDGKYLVFSGADTARQYLGDASGGRFVLDLGAKRAAAQRQPLGLTQSVTEPLASSAYYGGGN